MALLECDLVLKGGVTSGTVYPRAIAALAQRYRLRSIGGASAGAIAAAAAAAAEWRRQMSADGRSAAGFAGLRTLPEELGAPGAKKTGPVLLELFQPQRPLRALFRFLLRFLGNEPRHEAAATPLFVLKVAGWALYHFPLAALVGGGVALGFALLIGLGSAPWWSWLIAPGFVLSVSATAALIGALLTALRLPTNDFGMCRGFERTGDKEDPWQLTSWLSTLLQRTSGLASARLLTFGHLAQRKIDLRVVTSNLSYGHPQQVPFRAGEPWPFFEKAAWEALFPREVIEHLMAYSPSRAPGSDARCDAAYLATVARLAERGLLPLPDTEQLPVIIAVRLSLSFPLLLSAVPLWFVDPAEKAGEPRKCWLSDGGISSNFPLHFFDSPIPGRPTFAINLEQRSDVVKEDRVFLPPEAEPMAARSWTELENASGPGALAGFLLAIFNVMQNWRDNSLLRLPGYGDRVVTVRLKPREGGLNLKMSGPLIGELADHGEAAAAKLQLHFHPSHAADRAQAGITASWDNHRWVRLRSCLAGIDTLAREGELAWNQPSTVPYDALLDPTRTPQSTLSSYEETTDAQRTFALACLSDIRAVIRRHQSAFEPEPLHEHGPRAPLRFRLTSET